MASKRLTKNEVDKARALVVRIQGISSCQISTDEYGEITEVHVVATMDKSPKFIARDVESCLKAEMGLDVDHRKIGVVLFDSIETDPPQTTAPPELTSSPPTQAPKPSLDPPAAPKPSLDPPAAPKPTLTPPAVPKPTLGENIVEFPVEEYPSRFAFQSVNLFISPEGARAEVELVRDTVVAFGTTQGERPVQTPLVAVANATLRAISEYLDETSVLCLGGLRRINVDERRVIAVIVDLIKGRDRKSLAGASIVGGDENQAVVFATLDAVNRILGKLDFKNALEYRIK